MTAKEIEKMEWTTFVNWEELLETDSGNRVTRYSVGLLLETIICLSIVKLKCDRKDFIKIFKEKNKEFYHLKDRIFKVYGYITISSGVIVALKQLLKVPVGVKFTTL